MFTVFPINRTGRVSQERQKSKKKSTGRARLPSTVSSSVQPGAGGFVPATFGFDYAERD